MKTVLFASVFSLSLALVPAVSSASIHGGPQPSRAQVAEGESLQVGSTNVDAGESLQVGSANIADARGSDAFDRMFIRSGEFNVMTIV